MLDYFEDKIRFIEHLKTLRMPSERNLCDGRNYLKFYMREQFRQSEIDFDKAVERFNKFQTNSTYCSTQSLERYRAPIR